MENNDLRPVMQITIRISEEMYQPMADAFLEAAIRAREFGRTDEVATFGRFYKTVIDAISSEPVPNLISMH